jgi:predicted membrane channel-forming protein YqfA (hemolysin III family)
MKVEKFHLVIGIVYAIGGMILGMVMAESGDHTQHVTHAHAMLLGFVVSALYAVFYRVWGLAQGMLALIQTALHHVGTIVIVIGLYILYGAIMPEDQIGPILGIASALAVAGMAMMLWFVIRGGKAEPAV